MARRQAEKKYKDHEFTIIITNKQKQKTANKKTTKNIFQTVHKKNPKVTINKVIVLRKLINRDYKIIIITKKTKKTLEKNNKQLQAIIPSVTI